MSLYMWSKRWLRTSFILLMVLITCSLMLFVNLLMDRHNNTSNLSISQVRLTVNPLLLELEQKQQQLTDPATQDHLRSIAQENGIELTYVGLDGVVVVSSSPSLEGTQLNRLWVKKSRSTSHFQSSMNDKEARSAMPSLQSPYLWLLLSSHSLSPSGS